MSRSGPLRRIIGYVGMPMGGAAYLRTLELLECGHAQAAVHDMIGETNAVRRRCRGCVMSKPLVSELVALAKLWNDGKQQEMIREPDVMQTGLQLIM